MLCVLDRDKCDRTAATGSSYRSTNYRHANEWRTDSRAGIRVGGNATHQFGERHKAELENVKLKSMLKEQIKVAKSLESVLRKRATIQVWKQQRLIPSLKRILSFSGVRLGRCCRCTVPTQPRYPNAANTLA